MAARTARYAAIISTPTTMSAPGASAHAGPREPAVQPARQKRSARVHREDQKGVERHRDKRNAELVHE